MPQQRSEPEEHQLRIVVPPRRSTPARQRRQVVPCVQVARGEAHRGFELLGCLPEMSARLPDGAEEVVELRALGLAAQKFRENLRRDGPTARLAESLAAEAV